MSRPKHSVQTDLHTFFKVQKNNKESFKTTKKLNQDIVYKPQKKIDNVKLETTSKNKHLKAEESTTVNKQNTHCLAEGERVNFKSSELTPKRKEFEDGEEPSRKRKRQQLEEQSNALSETPPSDISEEILNSSKKELKLPSVKKKLNLDEVTKPREQKLDPIEVKRELGKCARLDELRSRLLKLNKCEEKLQAFRSQTLQTGKEGVLSSPTKLGSSIRRDIRNGLSPYKLSSPIKEKRTPLSPCKVDGLRLNHFSTLDIEVPVSPSKSPAKLKTPVKSCSERFRHLTEPPSSQLQLPYKYQIVKETFHAVDTVVSLLHNRQEVITFSKLKPAVQQMIRKTFMETHLGQLKTVFPLAYFFAQEKSKSRNLNSYNNVSYELTVKPRFDYKADSKAVHNSNQDLNIADFSSSYKYRKMDSVVLVERRNIFHNALLEILKRHHNKFLQTLDPPIKLDGILRRWHPEFALEETELPDPSPLPQPPKEDCPDTAKDVLDKARNVFSVNQRMKSAMESAASAVKAAPTAAQTVPSQSNNEVAAALKGVSLSLLQKIRAREASKTAREMTRSAGASRELEMLSRLPELARVLRSLFVTEKKAALPREVVITKVIASHSVPLSSGEAEKHLNLLMEKIPGWCTSHNVRSGVYLKIDKTRQLQQIIDQLNAIIKQKT